MKYCSIKFLSIYIINNVYLNGINLIGFEFNSLSDHKI